MSAVPVPDPVPVLAPISLAYNADQPAGEGRPLTLSAIKDAMARMEAESRASVTLEARTAVEARARAVAETRALKRMHCASPKCPWPPKRGPRH
ncbi:MAG: hypothetical protein EXR28_01520 [Betaproteobacteria bacterium]|nr:hypothetical protein [Betaproteobacteria bacterium]